MNLQPTIPRYIWKQAPWRLLAFVGIVLLMGGLVTLAPALRESYGLLVVLVVGLGFASLAAIDHWPRKDVADRNPTKGTSTRGEVLRPRMHWEPAVISAGGPLLVRGFCSGKSSLVEDWQPSQGRIRFLLGTLETFAEPTHRSQVKMLVDEIQESWNVCFMQHGSSLRRACHARRTIFPQELFLWESEPVVGALLEETFEDLGFQVMRMPTEWLRVIKEHSSTQASEPVDQVDRFYVEIHRHLPSPTEGSFWERDREGMVPLEQLSSSELLAEEALPVEQREVVLAALGRLFEKALEAARLQRRNPLHSHGR